MSAHNPDLQPPHVPNPNEAIQPEASDFVETPDSVLDPASGGHEPLPFWIYLICGLALFLAGSSFTGFNTFGLGLLDSGPGGPVSAGSAQVAIVPETQMTLGKKIYNGNCANCHQASGIGQPGKYPPLVASEFVTGSKERLAALLLKGLDGPLTMVPGGGAYGTQLMPAQEAALTPDKLANVMTYIRASWGNTANAVSTDEVNAAKTKFAAQTAAYCEADLLKIAPNGPDPSDKK